MRVLTYRSGDHWALGVRTDHGVIDVRAASRALRRPTPDTPEAFFEAGPEGVAGLEALTRYALRHLDQGHLWLYDEAELELGPCVPRPEKILCVGRNYALHAAESGSKPPPIPLIFSKFNNALAGAGETIPIPEGVEQVDYEAELAVVIGRRGKHIPEAEAMDYVLGYCNANDVTSRRWQRRTSQWLLGKTPDKFLPLGPYLVTADEVADPHNLRIRSWLNGELRQDANTGQMIFSIPYLIGYVSQVLTLKPGDVILTGTPEGVIMGMDHPVWMKPGDVVTVEVEGLGRLTNRLVRE